MNAELILLDYIQAHWEKTQPTQLIRGVWVALHEKLTEAAYEPSTPVIKAWFVTDRAITQFPPISFKLFAENKLKVRVNESHEMGESNFAPYPEESIYYMDCIFAPSLR